MKIHKVELTDAQIRNLQYIVGLTKPEEIYKNVQRIGKTEKVAWGVRESLHELFDLLCLYNPLDNDGEIQ